ncbi:hypothetical protein MP638_004266 [Amoeboaphelidium occidentale]|nr:hypothetical protein MP638_004266 [Amoeboaphelidium occidentale]
MSDSEDDLAPMEIPDLANNTPSTSQNLFYHPQQQQQQQPLRSSQRNRQGKRSGKFRQLDSEEQDEFMESQFTRESFLSGAGVSAGNPASAMLSKKLDYDEDAFFAIHTTTAATGGAFGGGGGGVAPSSAVLQKGPMRRQNISTVGVSLEALHYRKFPDYLSTVSSAEELLQKRQK